MILNEFKAWFAGITATMGATPTIEQWDLIKKEIAAIGFDKEAAKAAQGPFVAQNVPDKPKPNMFDNAFTKALEEDRRRREKERQDEKGNGIDGFPKGWPGKQYDNYPGWPYDAPKDRYTLGKGDMFAAWGGPGTAETPEQPATIIYFNPR